MTIEIKDLTDAQKAHIRKNYLAAGFVSAAEEDYYTMLGSLRLHRDDRKAQKRADRRVRQLNKAIYKTGAEKKLGLSSADITKKNLKQEKIHLPLWMEEGQEMVLHYIVRSMCNNPLGHLTVTFTPETTTVGDHVCHSFKKGFHLGASWCSPKDNFSPTKGARLAHHRAVNGGHIQIPLREMGKFVGIESMVGMAASMNQPERIRRAMMRDIPNTAPAMGFELVPYDMATLAMTKTSIVVGRKLD